MQIEVPFYYDVGFDGLYGLEVTEVNINRVIQETLSLIDHQLKKAGIQVKARLNASTPIKEARPISPRRSTRRKTCF